MNETKQLLAEIRGALSAYLDGEAVFRERISDEWPEDSRNARSAEALRLLAEDLRTNDDYDDTPALRKLLELTTKYDMTSDVTNLVFAGPGGTGFEASQFRFHNPLESEDGYLNRFADAVAEGWAEANEDAA